MFLLLLSLLLVIINCFHNLKYGFKYILLFICLCLPIIEFSSFLEYLSIEGNNHATLKKKNSNNSFNYVSYDNGKDEINFK